ncbi:PilW family protein [Glaciecola sp. SC05]|uniref:PilW family protein n=1 Tax=Glaciecola sp. SC05 TaxID=1987355 RepID=UPI003528FE2D
MNLVFQKPTMLVKQRGFTLVEIMISLALGLIISGAVIQILVSNSVTDSLNRAVSTTQESGRFIVTRMRQELMMVGLYDALNPNLSQFVDTVEEESFVRSHPVPVPGDFVTRVALGALQGSSGASDHLVVSMQGTRDCRGYKLGYAADEEFYVVNEYFVEDNKLKCRGFDGRVLRGQKPATGHNGHAAFTLLDNVLSFQALYGITDPADVNGHSRPVRYVDASQLTAAYAANAQVVTLRLAIVIKGDGEVFLDQPATFKLLNENPITAPDNGMYKAFETTITLRNMRNFARGSA